MRTWILLFLFVVTTSVVTTGDSVTTEVVTTNTLSIYLARHGQTDWNLQKRPQGSTDIPLNETGRAQAANLKMMLKDVHLDRIYCSALSRSHKTAEIVASGNTPIQVLPDLNEQAIGMFEGKYLDGRDAAILKEYEKRSSDPDDTMSGGESINQHFARVQKALQQIRANHPHGGQILIVGHGGTNAQVLRALLNLTAQQADEIQQDNSELYLIELTPNSEPQVWKRIPSNLLKEL